MPSPATGDGTLSSSPEADIPMKRHPGPRFGSDVVVDFLMERGVRYLAINPGASWTRRAVEHVGRVAPESSN